tara:strand:- start:501 stop:722 length:222 start_codon:yes stop_codon:yes gene_type:complete
MLQGPWPLLRVSALLLIMVWELRGLQDLGAVPFKSPSGQSGLRWQGGTVSHGAESFDFQVIAVILNSRQLKLL